MPRTHTRSEEDNDARVTTEGGIPRETAVWPSGEEEKLKEKTLVSSSKALTSFSSLL